MIGQFIAWYLVVQLISLAALPLTIRLLHHLPDRGYAFAKSLGILGVGLLFWLGYSYGLLRNDMGNAWLALGLFAALSALVGWPRLADLKRKLPIDLRYVLVVETLFLVGFVLWAAVRAYDPAANHTEQPMDLMFMNSIWTSATFPPQDAWLGGFAVSYYYLGYWLLTTLGRLAGQPPEIAYNLGQACWYGLLLTGSFGVAYNLVARAQTDEGRNPAVSLAALAGGLLGAIFVAVAGNLQILLEWSYANGMSWPGLLNWFNVYNFPDNATVSNHWYINYDWWWWRSSRVIEDLDLLGNHIEVIDEFPAFSYVLGDNHPHVLAMPMVTLVVGVIMNVFFQARLQPATGNGNLDAVENGAQSPAWWRTVGIDLFPLGWVGYLLLAVIMGVLIFMNTWDFPPYWLLFVLAVALIAKERLDLLPHVRHRWIRSAVVAGVAGGGVVLVSLLVYLPYFLTAQSQAGGFVPNLFNPTRFPQFLLMFGPALLFLMGLLLLVWPEVRPGWGKVGTLLAAVYGLPALFLLSTMVLAQNTGRGSELLASMPLPPDVASHMMALLARWLSGGLTFLVIGGLLTLFLAVLWQQAERPVEKRRRLHPADLFVVLLAVVGLLLVYAPEFIYLRDNFGTRMNTIFKFYYQAWLLFGVSGAYVVVRTLTRAVQHRTGSALASVAPVTVGLLLMLGATLFTVAGAYAKTNGFASDTPTFNAIAFVEQTRPDEWAAIQWVRESTAPDALVLEGKGGSYRADHNRISTATGRPTLLGWEGHESQWRGKSYGDMAGNRAATLELIYRSGSVDEILFALDQWDIDYVYVGPNEREQYGITPGTEERLAQSMELVFDADGIRIYRRRG